MREQLKCLIENTDQPALLIGPRLTILDSNAPAKAILPAAKQSDGLQAVFPGCDPSECTKRLEQGEWLTLSDPLTPGLTLELTPMQCQPVLALGRLASTACPAFSQEELSTALAAFSHTYRQPLSDMFGMLSVVSNHLHANTDDSCDAYLDGISQSCYRMLRSFSNLTELYKYHSGVYASPAEHPVDLWEMTRSLCESAGLLTRSTGIPLTFDLPGLPTLVLCSQDRFATAFSNLLANSCKFTREGNAIYVSGRISGGNAIITVADRGLGIPQPYLGRVLEPFFSWDPNGAPFAGLGIGLSLVRSFAQNAGGSLALQSREMEGTTAALSLPVYTGSQPPTGCFDASHLLIDRFSPLYVALAEVCKCPK